MQDMLEGKMLVELIEIKEDSKGNYFLNNIYVNPAQIVFLTENRTMKQKLKEGKMNLGLNQNFTNFTNVRMNFHTYVSEITVVGDPGLIESKIHNKEQKRLLKS